MQLNQNIRFDHFLTDKIDQNKLNCIECFQLSAAEQLCKEFPQLPVVLVPQQQSRPILQIPPAIFVQVFQVQRHKRLDGFCRVDFGGKLCLHQQGGKCHKRTAGCRSPNDGQYRAHPTD